MSIASLLKAIYVKNVKNNIKSPLKQNTMTKLTTFFTLLWCSGIALLLLPTTAQAFHIIGGEITYECIGGNNYRIRLTVYRDCYCTGCAEFDNPAFLAVYNNNNGTYQKLSLSLPNAESVSPPDIICAETLPDICVHQAEYATTITLSPFATEGYTLVYQRYSRNQTIANLVAPAQTGSSYTAIIPPIADAICNDSPVFNSFPPTVICANTPIYIDQSASDADGDSLVYELCDPLIGGNDACPQPGNTDIGCDDIPAPPYDTVTWASGYSATNPLGGSTPLTINPQTGLLTGIAPNLGQYVVGICVSEYRNGVLINQIRRDFQLNIADCVAVLAAAQADSISAVGDYYITDCSDDFTVQFINSSIGGITYLWDFGDPTATDDISNLVSPIYEYPDTGTYNVQLIAYGPGGACWDTAHIILKLYPTLMPAFSYLPQCANTPLQFTDLSTTTYGQITNWQWTFDATGSSTAQNPTFTYGAGGTYNVNLSVETDIGCVEDITQQVIVYPTPDATFSTTSICPEVPVQFSATAGSAANIASWQWNLGDPTSPNNNSTQPNTSNTYETGSYTATLTVTSINNCTQTYQLPFTVYNYFDAEMDNDAQTCAGVPITLSATDEYDWFNYQWSPSESLDNSTLQAPTAIANSTTVYTVTVSDPNGCTDTDQLTLTINPLPSVNITGDTTVCEGASSQLSAIVDNTTTSYTWSGGELSNNNSLTVNVLPTADQTTYILNTINQYNCVNSDSITLYVIRPVVATASGNSDICAGEQVQLLAAGSDTYNWQPATGLNDASIANPIASPSNNTTYIVTVSNECFSDTASVAIVVHPLPIVDAGQAITLNVGESGVLNAHSDDSNNSYVYAWLPNTNMSGNIPLSPTVAPLASVTYQLSATSLYGCVATDSVRVTVTNIFEIVIPNAFSPNSDGVNDQFSIISSKGLKEIRAFRVYNRWGQMVFEGNSSESAWDGTRQGIDQELGVYVFYIDALTFLDQPYQYKGNLTLIR
jgi:gliding motility-associated-like protein